MSTDYKEIIRQEFIKCLNDPVYFMKKYCLIQHPIRGRTEFNLYPFQEKVLTLFKNNDYSIVLKSRQLGISTLVAGYSLWLMTFYKDKNILVIATKQDTAKNLVTKVRFMYDNLPSWLQIKTVEHNKLSLRLKNGSQVKAVSAAGDAGRSEALSLLVIDEAAFIEENKIEDIWASSQQTLSTGGSSIILSTPNGIGNFFHRMWLKAESGENNFLPIRLPWTVHPERNQEWRDEQNKILGPKIAAQECDTDFLSSGDNVFDMELIQWYEKTHIKDPLERRGLDQNYWIWEYPDYGKEYVILADVARGDGGDYSAFHVLDIKESRQVAEFKGQIGTKDFGNLLCVVGTEWNNALLVIDNASMGWATIQQILERDYENIYYSVKDDSGNIDHYIGNSYDLLDKSKLTPGFTISSKNRPLLISKLDSYLREKTIIFQSKRTIAELKTFIWKNGRPEAQTGYNDDLVMSAAIGVYLRDTTLTFMKHGQDLSRATLSSFKRSNQYDGAYNGSMRHNPWKIDDGRGGSHDLSWLLQ
jgi:hypothetical protein